MQNSTIYTLQTLRDQLDYCKKMLVLFNMQTDKRKGSSTNFDRIKFQDITGAVKIELVQHKFPFVLHVAYRNLLIDAIEHLEEEILSITEKMQ